MKVDRFWLLACIGAGLVIVCALARIGECAEWRDVNFATAPLPVVDDTPPFVLHCQLDTAQGVSGFEIPAATIEQQGDVWILDGDEIVGSRVYVQQRGELCGVEER